MAAESHLNSSAVGNYDDYLVQELVPYIDRTYRTLGGAGVESLANPVADTARCAGACYILTSGAPWPATAATCSSSCAMPAISLPFATSSAAQGDWRPGITLSRH